MTQIELDPNLLATLQALESHAVEHVLIGEVAQAIHNGGGFISSVAIVPGRYGRNVDRLASALKKLDAHLPNGQPIDWRATDLRSISPCTLRTKHADIELNFVPGGTNGYADVFDDAGRVGLAAGVNPHVASRADLERIERSERHARGGPPAALPELLAPEPASPEPDDDDIPPARAPSELPPEPPGDWPDEIRASRVARR
jgi:hypothetical protein